jgi:hypothetical protein
MRVHEMRPNYEFEWPLTPSAGAEPRRPAAQRER